ncbi:FG-GAP-like repeat-containing protein [Bizionia sp. KMM 8389]
MKKKLLIFTGLIFMGFTVKAQIEFNGSTIDGNTGSEPYSVASGHFTNDSYLDLAICTYQGSTVSWYKNNGDGTFATRVDLVTTGSTTLSYVESITVADLNNDGNDDIIASSYSTNRVVWFENNGDETFEPAALISNGISGAGHVETANIDNDSNGNLDIIISEYSGNKVSYLLGNGDGTFGTKRDLFPAIGGSGPASFDIADYDADGDLDVVVNFVGHGNIKVYDNRLVQDGLDGSGNVPFTAYDNDVTTGNSYLWRVLFADINDDGNLEIVKSNNEPGSNPGVAYYINDISGTTTTFTETTFTSSINKPAAIAIADFNNDSFNDLLIGNGRATDNDLVWFTSNATGGFGSEILIDEGSFSSLFDIEVQDFDNDGDLDFVGVSYLQDDLFIYLNDLFTLKTDDFNTTAFSIYPNPTSQNLNFNTQISTPFEVTVFDVLGKQVMHSNVTNKRLDVSQLTNGIYLLKLSNTNKTYKFVKH